MPNPNAARRRRFTIADATVLVALCAVGLKAHEWIAGLLAQSHLSAGPVSAATVVTDIRRVGFFKIPIHVTYWFEIAIPWLLTIVFSLLVFRWLPPRPPRARRARQRGSGAIAAASGAVLVVWAGWLAVLVPLLQAKKLAVAVAGTSWDHPHLFYRSTIVALVAAGAAVAAAWVVMPIRRRSRTPADWVEKAGIVLGVVLILAGPFYLWLALIRH